MNRDFRTIDVASVYISGVKAATIKREDTFVELIYESNFDGSFISGKGIGFNLPYAREPVRLSAGALHPFFSNLLPEGLRLIALKERVKTSLSDELTLLLAAGKDTVGDVSVVPFDDEELNSIVEIDESRIHEADFEKVFSRHIEYKGTPAFPSIPGVQNKISAQMLSMPVTSKNRATYILKLETEQTRGILENEAFFLKVAIFCGIETTEFKLVKDSKNTPGLLVKRFDRFFEKDKTNPIKIHVEDGCQICNRYPADKYRLSASDIVRGICQFSTAPKVEALSYLKLYAFCYLICNGDFHSKNVSLICNRNGIVTLSPAYDLVCTLPFGDRNMAIKLQGRDDNLKRKDLVDFGRVFDISDKTTIQMLDKLLSKYSKTLKDIEGAPMPAKSQRELIETTKKRCEDLS